MKFGSVCSGIEAASCAWESLGWKAQWFSEIEPFPSAVLSHHYSDVPNFGDMTKFKEWDQNATIDVLVGGTPCQSFSVAGLRKGLDDPRGNLMLTYLAIANKYRPKWLVWENVPGVLSSGGGEDFASLLRGMGELGYGFAYRVLDAQYFGVAQRRRRVFVVGCLGDWRSAAAVLFESHSLSGNPAPSRKTGEKIAPAISTGAPFSRTGNERVECDAIVPTIAKCITRGIAQRYDSETETMIPIYGGSDSNCADTVTSKWAKGSGGPMYTLNATGVHGVAQPIDFRNLRYYDGEISGTMQAKSSGGYSLNYMTGIQQNMAVRRLTPVECERLQGFPDNYTNIPWRKKDESPDGPRYKALGNSMAVPVMKWIGQRIQMVEKI